MEATAEISPNSGSGSRTESIKDRKFGDYLSDTFYDLTFKSAEEYPEKRDNANINTDSTMGTMLKYGSLASVYFTDHYILPKKFSEAEAEGWVHWHDKDFGFLTINCCQIDLPRLFKGGFNTGHGTIREPQSIMSYASLACIALQANQNEMFGGQSLAAVDFSLAPGVRKSFKKNFKEYFLSDLDLVLDNQGQESINDFLKLNPAYPTYLNENSKDQFYNQLIQYLVDVKHYKDIDLAGELIKNLVDHSYNHAVKITEKQTHQAMEAMIHNLNTLHSRAGELSARGYGNVA